MQHWTPTAGVLLSLVAQRSFRVSGEKLGLLGHNSLNPNPDI